MAFTTIDKNLLIAALESALLYAQHSAGVSSLEDLTTQVAALRSAFDSNPASVTDAQLETMIATLQAVEIPDPTQLSRLLTASNVTETHSYLAVCSWATLLNKPATFPPAAHQHPWSEVTYKPATFPPAAHTHPDPEWNAIQHRPDQFPPTGHQHAWGEVTNQPATYPPATHTHTDLIADWDTLQHKPATFPPATHSHPEYEGGGGSGATASTWSLLNPPGMWFLAGDVTTNWSAPLTTHLQLSGEFPTDAQTIMMLMADHGEDGSDTLLTVGTSGTDVQLTFDGNGTKFLSYAPRSIEMGISVAADAITIEINGQVTSYPYEKLSNYGGFSVSLNALHALTLFGYWPGELTTTTPLFLYEARGIEGGILREQIAQKMGGTANDFPLNGGTVLYKI